MEGLRERVARWIAGDIVLSPRPGLALRRWREMFNASQTALAVELGVSPSVISDYESGRRKSPGIGTVKKIVAALIEHDSRSGGRMLGSLSRVLGAPLPSEVVLDLRELEEAVTVERFCELLKADILVCPQLKDRKIFGYTVIDSLKAILSLSSEDFRRFYGMTEERALVFTEVGTGRSPLVAVKVVGLTPGLVVLHGKINRIDPLAVKIAEQLHLPVAISRLPGVEEIIQELRSLK
jgi:putative transcriptional regulator